MNLKHLGIIFVLAGSAAISGCQNQIAEKPATASFADQPSYSIDVATLEFADEYKAPMQAPNIDHTLPSKLQDMVKSWASDRFKPKGNNKSMRVVLSNASVVEAPLSVQKGVKGFFKKEQSARYDAKLEVSLKIYDGQMLLPDTELNVVVNRSRSVPENFSVAEKEKFLQELENSMLTDLNSEVDKQVKSYFGKYLIY